METNQIKCGNCACIYYPRSVYGTDKLNYECPVCEQRKSQAREEMTENAASQKKILTDAGIVYGNKLILND